MYVETLHQRRKSNMKTRDQLYHGESEKLLRFITSYHALRYEQIMQLFHNNDSVKSLITSLVKQGRIIYDKVSGLLCDSPEAVASPDYGMIAAFWVLLDFKKGIVYHTSGEFPVKLHFFSSDEEYEVIYVGLGQEFLINHVLENLPPREVRRLLVLESKEQAAKLSCQGIAAFCLVDSSGTVSYYQRR